MVWVDAEVIQIKLFCQLHWQLKVVWTLTVLVGGRGDRIV